MVRKLEYLGKPREWGIYERLQVEESEGVKMSLEIYTAERLELEKKEKRVNLGR